MNLEPIIDVVNHKLMQSQNRPLNSTEILIIKGIWQYKTYNQIAQDAGYSPGYFTNVVAPELFRRLSKLINQRVTKKNCRELLTSYAAAQKEIEITPLTQNPVDIFPDVNQDISPCFPSGSLPLNSPFYLERSPMEEQAYQEISKSGALIRIKAPREMGKTSLLLRLLDYANRQGYRTVSLNLEQIDEAKLNDLNRFLRWLCANVSHQLQLEPKLDEFWDEDIGSKVSCTMYFRGYLLKQVDFPLVLALDEVNQLFEHPQVAKDVLPLLRSWYEEAKRLLIWQKLRLVVVHSTEIYVPLQLKQSPFNVGLPIELGYLSLEQVQELAKRYKLEWKDNVEARQLMAMVGGHPALVQIALYHLSREEITLPQLLQTAPTPTGIYSHHLQRHQVILQEQPKLKQVLDTIMGATKPVPLEPIVAYKLNSMGLINLDGNKAIPSCELYRQYFEKK